jgi:two-component system, sensor histidine kinase YesM
MDLTSDTKLPKTNRKRQHFSGIGVRNVHERIQLIYGDSYGVEISSKLGEWTKVRISLPFQSI